MGWLLGCFRCARSDRSASPPPPPSHFSSSYKYRSPVPAAVAVPPPRLTPRPSGVAPNVAPGARRSHDFIPPPPRKSDDAFLHISTHSGTPPLRQRSCRQRQKHGGGPIPSDPSETQNECFSHPLSQLDELEAELEDLRRQIDRESEDARRMREEVTRLKCTVKTHEVFEANDREEEEERFDTQCCLAKSSASTQDHQVSATVTSVVHQDAFYDDIEAASSAANARSPRTSEGACLQRRSCLYGEGEAPQMNAATTLSSRSPSRQRCHDLLRNNNISGRGHDPEFDPDISDDDDQQQGEDATTRCYVYTRDSSLNRTNEQAAAVVRQDSIHSLRANYNGCTQGILDGEAAKPHVGRAVSPLRTTPSLYLFNRPTTPNNSSSNNRGETFDVSEAGCEDGGIPFTRPVTRRGEGFINSSSSSSSSSSARGMATKKRRSLGNAVDPGSVQEPHLTTDCSSSYATAAAESQTKRQRQATSTGTSSSLEGSRKVEMQQHFFGCDTLSTVSESAEDGSYVATSSSCSRGSTRSRSSCSLEEEEEEEAADNNKTAAAASSSSCGGSSSVHHYHHDHDDDDDDDASWEEHYSGGESYSRHQSSTTSSSSSSSHNATTAVDNNNNNNNNNERNNNRYTPSSPPPRGRHRYEVDDDDDADNNILSSASYSLSVDDREEEEEEETESELSPERCFSPDPPISHSQERRGGSSVTSSHVEEEKLQQQQRDIDARKKRHRYRVGQSYDDDEKVDDDDDGYDSSSLVDTMMSDDDASADSSRGRVEQQQQTPPAGGGDRRKRLPDIDRQGYCYYDYVSSTDQTPIKLPEGVATPSSSTAAAADDEPRETVAKSSPNNNDINNNKTATRRRKPPTASVLTPVENVSQWMQLKQNDRILSSAAAVQMMISRDVQTSPAAAAATSTIIDDDEKKKTERWKQQFIVASSSCDENWTPGRKERPRRRDGCSNNHNNTINASSSSLPSPRWGPPPPREETLGGGRHGCYQDDDVRGFSRWVGRPGDGGNKAAAVDPVPVDVSLSHWLLNSQQQLTAVATHTCKKKKAPPQRVVLIHGKNHSSSDESSSSDHNHQQQQQQYYPPQKQENRRHPQDHQQQPSLSPATKSSYTGIDVSITKASKWAYSSSNANSARITARKNDGVDTIRY